jgi:hypothetical protein
LVAVMVYVAGGTLVKTYWPVLPVTVVREALVVDSVSVIVAPGTTAPLWSSTTPTIVPELVAWLNPKVAWKLVIDRSTAVSIAHRSNLSFVITCFSLVVEWSDFTKAGVPKVRLGWING